MVARPKHCLEKRDLVQLRDTRLYRILTTNSLKTFQLQLHTLVQTAFEDGVIPKKVYDGLLTEDPKDVILYILPKIH